MTNKLERNTHGGVFMGLVQGIVDFTGWDPVILRGITLALLLAGNIVFPVIVYFIISMSLDKDWLIIERLDNDTVSIRTGFVNGKIKEEPIQPTDTQESVYEQSDTVIVREETVKTEEPAPLVQEVTEVSIVDNMTTEDDIQ